MVQYLKAPVVIDYLYTSDGTTPLLIWDGTGTASLFIQSSKDQGAVVPVLVGVVFGPNASMPVASSANAFPVPFEGITWKMGPNTRYMSICELSGDVGYGAVNYYFEGQTDVTT